MPNYNPLFLNKGNTNFANSALPSYLLEEYYKRQTTEIFDQFNPNYIDLWYDVPLYGKIDISNKLVYPKTSKMSYPMLEGTSTRYYGFDFMIKAIDDFTFFMRKATTGGKTSLGRLYNNFKVKECFVDPFQQHLIKSTKIIEAFNLRLVTNPPQKRKVIDFESYMCEFVDFLHFFNEEFLFYDTFMSIDNSHSGTGLAFRFVIENNNNDFLKNKFYIDPEFYKFVQTAANFGFRINRNVPGMLLADLRSKPMMSGKTIKRGYDPIKKKLRTIQTDGYLREKFIPSLDVFFNEYYDRVIDTSFGLFVSQVKGGYDEYKNKVDYIIDHGKAYSSLQDYIKNVSGIEFFREKEKIFKIKNLNEKKFNDNYFLMKFENILANRHENKARSAQYHNFKKLLKTMILDKKSTIEILDKIEDFYTPTKIYDPKTNKLFWNSPKKQLTMAKSYVNLQTKDQPTVGKFVTEFTPDL
tara:strand:+ start:4588 stop:5988 length:1401 start_codon:yes stop_codon:yes gene_type:complete